MAWFVGQSIVMLIMAFVLGLLVGYLIWGRRFQRLDASPVIARQDGIYLSQHPSAPASSSTTQTAAQTQAQAVVDVAAAERPTAAAGMVVLPASVPSNEEDRLERIEGIGPKIANALRDAGLSTYAAIADADDDTLRAALTAAKVRLAPSLGSWAAQARLLADGNLEAHAAMKASLVAGRSAQDQA